MSEKVVYFGNELSAFEAGVQMDLRLRLAIDFLKSPAFEGAGRRPEGEQGDVAACALTLASSLLEQAEQRGWLKDLPETGEISGRLKRHIERNVNAQAHQMHAARCASGPQVIPGMTLPQ